MLESSLEQLIYGRAIVADKPAETELVLAHSAGFNADEAASLLELLVLDPLELDGEKASQSIALIPLEASDTLNPDANLLLARSHWQKGHVPVYHFIKISGNVLSRLGDIDALLRFFDAPISPSAMTYAPLDALNLPMPQTWTLDKSVVLLKTLIDSTLNGDVRLLLGILGAVLSKGVVIRNFPKDNEMRLNLVRGLMLLLPSLARPELSFSSNSESLRGTLPKLIFTEAEDIGDYALLDWQKPEQAPHYFEHPYIAHLADFWHENVVAMVELIRRLDSYARMYLPHKELSIGLEDLVHRHQLELDLEAGKMLPVQEVMQILQEDNSLSNELRAKYLSVLLKEFFTERDGNVAQFIAKELSQNLNLRPYLDPLFEEILETQPDALYAFARLRLSQDEQPLAIWLKRLHEAAEKALNIVLESGDAASIDSWLTLLSREPLRYELSPILHKGILAARQAAAKDVRLAQNLLTVAVKRQPETLPNILSDEAILTNLPENILEAIQVHQPQAIESLAENSRELFLLAIQEVIQAQALAISSATVRALWQIHEQQQTNTLPPQFRPHLLILNLVEHPEVMLEGSISTLLTLILAKPEHDAFFYELAPILAAQDSLATPLVDAILQSGREQEDGIEILGKLLNNNCLNPQEVVDAYAYILAERQWAENTRPMSEQLARIMTQHPETDTVTGVLWKLAELSGEYRNEQMLKVALRRLMDDIAAIPTENQVVESVARLRKAIQWSAVGRNSLSRWWRVYAREQSTVQLQKLDKSLDSKRSLEDLRATVQTSLAMRRILTNRDLQEFADAIATTYSILQALSDGFDAGDKAVDSAVIREELEAREEELSPDLRHILATNLKELAQLITTLSDNRSKPTLMKSDESLERQLLTGEQSPQSALDVMRWLSGYLDGVQKGEGE